MNDIIAPKPEMTTTVNREAVRVGVARRVEPRDRHALTKVWARKQAIDGMFIRRWIAIRNEGCNFIRAWRETGEINRHAPQQRRGSSRLRKPESRCVEVRGHQCINHPRWSLWNRRTHRWHKRPVLVISRALLNPAANLRLLRVAQITVRRWRRHDVIEVGRLDARPDLACLKVERLDRRYAVRGRCIGKLRAIKPQLRLARLLVKPVAGKAVLRQNRTNIAVEIDGRVVIGSRCRFLCREPRRKNAANHELASHRRNIRQPPRATKRTGVELHIRDACRS